MTVKGSLFVPPLLAPQLKISTLEGHFLTVHRQDRLHTGLRPMICHGAGLVQRLDIELGRAAAVLTEQEPAEGVIDGGLAGGVVAVDGAVPSLEIQGQAVATLEIRQGQALDRDRSHCFLYLLGVQYSWYFTFAVVGVAPPAAAFIFGQLCWRRDGGCSAICPPASPLLPPGHPCWAYPPK